MDPLLVERIGKSDTMSAVDYERASQRRTALWQTVRAFFERYDLLLTPTLSIAPFPIGVQYPTEVAGRAVSSPLGWFPFTFPFSMTGQPSLSLPCGFTTEGLPVGLQIVGRRLADATVLRAAHAYEASAPWVQRRPSV
jgi:Asp-tRNA(Asn)/Glu-tRNA(Gln) amidotransferase A subunit family amidase